jgi:hypothetical protein
MRRDRSELDSLSRPERRALLRLLIRATAAAGGPPDPRLEPLVAAAPMHALPAAAAMHRVSGSVRRALDGAAGTSDAVRLALREAEQHATVRHLTFMRSLVPLARALDRAAIPWVLMKGPVLAATLYPGIGDRTYNDLDVLVGRRDFGRAMAILEELGFEHAIHDWARAEQMLAGQVSMSTPAVSIDLHWHLHYSCEDRRPFALDPEAMIGRSRRIEVSGLSVPTFDPVDTVSSLAFHAARSDGHRLVWLKDLERALIVGDPDPDELVRRCTADGTGPPVGLMLARARAVLGSAVPHSMIDALAPGWVRTSERAASAMMRPIQLHERGTLTRAFTRSIRSSLVDSVLEIPPRAVRLVRARRHAALTNETDDPMEKASYLRAVAAAIV